MNQNLLSIKNLSILMKIYFTDKKKSKTSTVAELRCKLGFKQHDIIMTKEQSALTKIMKAFANENILLQYYVLGCIADLHFLEHKLAIEVDEKGH